MAMPHHNRKLRSITVLTVLRWALATSAAAIIVLAAHAIEAADIIEFLSGAKAEGVVTKIDTQGKLVNFETTISGRKFQRVYPYNKIHAVTYQGKRYVLNEMGTAPERPSPRPRTDDSDSRENTTGSTDIKALITEAGRTPPDWYDATPLDYPKTLDLSWPEKASGGWNNQKNVGQYIWDVINPNPTRWRSGVRFMHHMLSVHKDDPVMRQRVMNELGRMYCELLQDYERAAFWYEQAGVGKGSPFDNRKSGAHLAECYYRLGNRKLAVDFMNKLPVTYALIKLWGGIGETHKCVQLAAAAAGSARFPSSNYLIIGDAYRVAGDYQKALLAYEKAFELASKSSQKQDADFKQRAAANIAALQALAGIDLSKTPAGAYRASSIGYEGPVEVEVRVAGNRIEDVRVTQHKEKQFYSSIADTTAKIVEKQGIKGVDATSGATITSEAIINASAKALADGAR